MSLSPLHLMRNFDSYMSGEVTIDPSAAIASGVMLQADPNSQIIIAAGVCIGMGTVLHARDGILEIEPGATLGAGVLLVGRGKIGANASIGSATTILNCSIEPEQVIAPNSLLGDTSRKVETDSTTASNLMPEVTQPSSGAKPDEQIQTQAQLAGDNSFLADSAVESKTASALTVPEVTQPSSGAKSDEQIQTQAQSANNNGAQVVYGKAALHQLMSTLFPHRQALNQPPPEGSTDSQSP